MFGPQYQPLTALATAPTIVSLPTDVSGESGPNNERRAEAFKAILKLISTFLIGDPPSAHVREPSLREVYQQRQLEHERIRIRHHVSQATRSALWGAHLAHLPQFENLPDYLALTNELYRRLLPLEPGMTVLDIGCGQRTFVRLMLTNQVYRSAHHSGWTAVMTCFQPHTDLSMLFRRHLHAANHDAFGSPAKIVLHYLGRLREAVRLGLLHNYEQDELARLLALAGAGSIQCFSVLDDQLLLALVRKTKSAG